MSLKKITISVFIFGFLFTSLLPAWAAEDSASKGEWQDFYQQSVLKTEKKVYPTLVDYKTADINGDGFREKIWLVGNNAEKDRNSMDNLSLVVQNGKTKKLFNTELKNLNSSQASLSLADFTGDEVKDILVTAPSDDEIIKHVLVSWQGSQPKVVFADEQNQGLKFTVKFIDGFKAEVKNSNLQKTLTLDLSSKKRDYLKKGIYNEKGQLLKEVKGYANPFSQLKAVDYDNDGIQELQGQQTVVGTSNSDTFLNVTSFWKFTDGQWKVRKIQISSRLPFTSKSSEVKDSYKLWTKIIKNKYGQVAFPQIKSLTDSLPIHYVNQDLEDMARKKLAEGNPSTKIKVDYQITAKNKDVLSVVFQGVKEEKDKVYIKAVLPTLTSMNFDLETGSQISLTNLFKEDKKSQNQINKLVKELAEKNSSATGEFPGLENVSGIYFTEQGLVFYYPQAYDYAKFSIPLEAIKTYFHPGANPLD